VSSERTGVSYDEAFLFCPAPASLSTRRAREYREMGSSPELKPAGQLVHRLFMSIAEAAQGIKICFSLLILSACLSASLPTFLRG
jgi:hypothetical protein